MEWSFGTVIWTMIAFYFWFMFIWAFIRVFADIFRRNDLSGGAKAGWILLLAVLPFLGILIYLIARPRMTEQDIEMMMEADRVEPQVVKYSTADEIAKLGRLRDEGKISANEYEQLKQKVMV